jgi:hypothetical protein
MFGAEGEIRTLEASLEDSHVASYITSASHCRFPIGAVPAEEESLPTLKTTNYTEIPSAIGSWQSTMLEPPIGLEPIPNSFEANRSSIKLRGRRVIADF